MYKRQASFRAGRFGIDGALLGVLAECGYRTDSSVTPMVHNFEDGGPDFRSAPQRPYRPSRADACARGDLPIVEVPVSVALSRRLPEPLRRAYARIPPATRLRGLLSRDYLRLLDFAWLYPPRFDLELMRRAARTLRDSGCPVLTVFLHSSELVPGAASLVRTEADLAAGTARLRGILEYCIGTLDAVPATLDEVGRELEPLLEPGGELALAAR